MAAPTRTLKITYAGVDFGAGTNRKLDGPMRIVSHNYESLVFEFDFLIAQTTTSAFASEVAVVEEALRAPNERLTISDGATTIRDFDPAQNTGFNSRGEIIKQGEVSADSTRARKYTASIEVFLPANESGKDGRRNVTITIIPNEADHLEISIEGEYTALGANGAFAQYNAEHDTFIASIISTYGAGGTFERTEKEPQPLDDEDKVLKFKTVMKEIVFDQSSGGTDHASIVDPDLKIKRSKDFTSPNAPGTPYAISAGRTSSGGSASKFITGQVIYQANIKKDFSANSGVARQADMISLFEGTIRPWIVSSTKQVLGVSVIAMILSEPETDLYSGRISVTGTFVAFPTGARVVDYSLEEELQSETGQTLVPVWSGKPFDKEKFPNAARLLMRRKEVFKAVLEQGNIARLAKVFGNPLSGEGGVPSVTGFSNGEWVLQSKRLVGEPKAFGIPNISGTSKLYYVVYTYESFYEFRTIPSGRATTSPRNPITPVHGPGQFPGGI